MSKTFVPWRPVVDERVFVNSNTPKHRGFGVYKGNDIYSSFMVKVLYDDGREGSVMYSLLEPVGPKLQTVPRES